MLQRGEVVGAVDAICVDLAMDPPSADKLDALFTRCDKNGDGVISLEEWSRFFHLIVKAADAHAQATIDRLAPQLELLRQQEREREQERERAAARERRAAQEARWRAPRARRHKQVATVQ